MARQEEKSIEVARQEERSIEVFYQEEPCCGFTYWCRTRVLFLVMVGKMVLSPDEDEQPADQLAMLQYGGFLKNYLQEVSQGRGKYVYSARG